VFKGDSDKYVIPCYNISAIQQCGNVVLHAIACIVLV